MVRGSAVRARAKTRGKEKARAKARTKARAKVKVMVKAEAKAVASRRFTVPAWGGRFAASTGFTGAG